MPEYMDVKIIEMDEKRCEQLNTLLDDDTMVIYGDGRDISLLVEEGVKNTQAFVALTGNTETNILACLTAKRLGVRKTVAMVDRKSTRLNSSHANISYAVFCLKKK